VLLGAAVAASGGCGGRDPARTAAADGTGAAPAPGTLPPALAREARAPRMADDLGAGGAGTTGTAAEVAEVAEVEPAEDTGVEAREGVGAALADAGSLRAVEARVTAVTASTLVLDTPGPDGAPLTLRTDGAPVPVRRDGRPATLTDVQPGDEVFAGYAERPDGSAELRRLELETPRR
jgi:hypothetical protein